MQSYLHQQKFNIMKKIITLLFCTAILSSAFAQKHNRDDWKRNNNHTVYQNTRYSIAQRDQMIQRVNREYDYKIQQVNQNRYMNRRERKRAVKTLQAQRAERISRIYSEYNNRYVYGDNRNHDAKHHGRNNGRDNYDR